jgi:hypothetical protein
MFVAHAQVIIENMMKKVLVLFLLFCRCSALKENLWITASPCTKANIYLLN